MSDDKITEWLLSLSMEELLDLETKFAAWLQAREQQKAREQERRRKAEEKARQEKEARLQEEARRRQEAEEKARLQREAENKARLQREAEEQARQQRAAEQAAATSAPRTRPIPSSIYASVDQLAANQGLDISGLMSEIAKKSSKKPGPGNGRR